MIVDYCAYAQNVELQKYPPALRTWRDLACSKAIPMLIRSAMRP
jgi:hypothetical protein